MVLKISLEKFDLIYLLPYVNSQSMAALLKTYVNEPALALDGGPDGMRFITRLLHEALITCRKTPYWF
jgi:ribosomal protein L3 glutamine methyltransferase